MHDLFDSLVEILSQWPPGLPDLTLFKKISIPMRFLYFLLRFDGHSELCFVINKTTYFHILCGENELLDFLFVMNETIADRTLFNIRCRQISINIL